MVILRIWKIVKEFDCEGEKREILDWYHLVENLNSFSAVQKVVRDTILKPQRLLSINTQDVSRNKLR